jgi:hypothetical protein
MADRPVLCGFEQSRVTPCTVLATGTGTNWCRRDGCGNSLPPRWYDAPWKTRKGAKDAADEPRRQNRQRPADLRRGAGFPGHTRVTLRTVLASLAAEDTAEEILDDFPALKAEHVQAAIAFAAASAEEDLPVPATPHF